MLLEATIDVCGRISALRVVRAPAPDLAKAAIDAVYRWRYTPTLLDGQPVPVQMTVTVNFKLM